MVRWSQRQGDIKAFTILMWNVEERIGLASANEELSTAKPRHGHAVFTLRVNLPLSTCHSATVCLKFSDRTLS